jgi:hypothetical protein
MYDAAACGGHKKTAVSPIPITRTVYRKSERGYRTLSRYSGIFRFATWNTGRGPKW